VRNETVINDRPMSAAIEQLNLVHTGSFVHEAVDLTPTCQELVRSTAADMQIKTGSFSASLMPVSTS